MERTAISANDFLKFIGVAKHLEMLNIERCAEISAQTIFKAKGSLHSLRSISMSINEQFGVLTVACICSFNSLRDICARGLKLESKELLFLTNGRITLNIGSAGGDYFLTLNAVADFDLFEDL